MRLPSVYARDFIAANQEDRADNVIPEKTKFEQVERLRAECAPSKSARGRQGHRPVVSEHGALLRREAGPQHDGR